MSRTPFVPAELLSKLWRAVIEFDMLQAGDKILIGLSGGEGQYIFDCRTGPRSKNMPLCRLTWPVILLTQCSHLLFPKQSWKLSADTMV